MTTRSSPWNQKIAYNINDTLAVILCCSGHVARKFIRFTWLEADTQPCPIRRTYVVRLCLAVSFPHSLPICPKHRTISHRKMELDSQLIARFYHQRRFVQSARLTLWKFVRSRMVSLRFEQGPCGRKLFQALVGADPDLGEPFQFLVS